MNGKKWKIWRKSARRENSPYTKEDYDEIKSDLRWMKPVDMAVKFARKVLKEMKKGDPDSTCGLWYDVNDGGGYRELCRAGGRCPERCKSGDCPYELANKLIDSLFGETK